MSVSNKGSGVAVKEQSGLNRGRRVNGFESVRNEKRFP